MAHNPSDHAANPPANPPTALPTALPELAIAQKGFTAPAPELIMLNDDLAVQLGLDTQWLRSAAGLKFLTGHGCDSTDSDHSNHSSLSDLLNQKPSATAYAGHQFGNFAGLLGDGRALLLATVTAQPGLTGLTGPTGLTGLAEPTTQAEPAQPQTQTYEIQAKGTGPTPFSRGGDGKATLSSALREYLISEAMYSLGVPTTRALAVIATGEQIHRAPQTPFAETEPTSELQPGGVVVRVATSHLRVGTFELVARAGGDTDIMERLIGFAAQRHGYEGSAAGVLRAVVKRQAELVAAWMTCGFVHGVMNTDNASIAGETIDYGPCVFLDHHDPRAVFSSIDRAGRYAFGAQPTIAGWNLNRLAEALLPQFTGSPEEALGAAREILGTFGDEFYAALGRRWLPKLGVLPSLSDDPCATELLQKWQGLLVRFGPDHTLAHRALLDVLDASPSDGALSPEPLTALVDGPDAEFAQAAGDFVRLWEETLAKLTIDRSVARELMAGTNPLYIPRNHLVTEALNKAVAGDMAPYRELFEVVTRPFAHASGRTRFAQPAPAGLGGFQSYCGT